MVLAQEGPEIIWYLVLALELLDLLLELHDFVVLVDLRGAVFGERAAPIPSYSRARLLSVESFMPSSSDRPLTVISPDRITFAAEALSCLSYRFLLWVILNTFRS